MTNDFRLFTPIRIEAGHCALLPIHLDHMAASAAALDFRWNRPGLEAALAEAMQEAASTPVGKLRIEVARDGSWTLSKVDPLFPDAANLQALLWPEPTDSQDPFFRHKTTRRPVYDRVVGLAHSSGFIDAIFHNESGLVTEGAVHSVFARFGDVWRAPTLSAGILPGVYREHLLATTPAAREEDFSVEELLAADEVWLTNALRGIRRVTVVRQ